MKLHHAVLPALLVAGASACGSNVKIADTGGTSSGSGSTTASGGTTSAASVGSTGAGASTGATTTTSTSTSTAASTSTSGGGGSASTSASTSTSTTTTAGTSSSSSSGSSDVTGTMIVTYYGEGAPVQQPVNLVGVQVEAFVWSGSAWTTYPGSGDASGNFDVPGVPAGSFVLDVAGSYVETSARVIDMGAEAAGRPGSTYGSGANAVGGTVTGMDPWQADDTIQWNAPNAAGAAYYPESSPPIGATSVTGQMWQWQGDLVDASQGDVVYATQLSYGALGAFASSSTLSHFASFKGLTQTNGTPLMVTGAFGSVPLQESATVDFRASQFTALDAAVNPSAGSEGASFAIMTQPGASAAGAFGYAISLYTVYSTSGDVSTAASYGNPFAASWGELAYAASTVGVSWAVGGASPFMQYGYIYQTLPIATVGATPITPVVSPPTSPTINGLSAFTAQTGVGTTPTLAWGAPTKGTPTAYHVTIYKLTAAAGATSAAYVTEIVTTKTTLTIPPALLAKGASYGFTISAVTTPIDATTKPFHWSPTIASADALTGVMTP